jgi:hypothetical protein
MTTLPVREMVLYKHGVGFFVREGAVSGESVALTFRQDEVNDALKSLAVFDKSGGQVLGIHYQTPMDRDARLANSSIRLSDTASLRDLLRGLRGRVATIQAEIYPETISLFMGRVIGLDEADEEADHGTWQALVSVLAADGTIHILDLNDIRTVQIQDEQAARDLSYFLNTSMSEDARRTVNVRLSAGEHQLVVFYVAPSPTWRVSYRLVAESEAGGEGGKALLQGWGLFDNRLEEDLEDVRVTLVAGQPISFIYDLYASRIPQRPTVHDEARVAPGPIEYERAITMGGIDVDDEPVLELAKGRSTSRMARLAMVDEPSRLRGVLQQAATPAVESKDTDETFQYAVTTPVSVKRGESALVPIISAEVSYQRELLYNAAKLPRHPVVALRFPNASSLTFERGPVTVVEDGDYKGEAVVSFSKAGQEIYLPYAVELGVRVTERQESATHDTGLRIEKAIFVYEQYQVSATKYIIENTTNRALTVTLEAPIHAGWELSDMRAPDSETAEARRWCVPVAPQGKSEFVRRERYRSYRQEQVRNLDYQKLAEITKHSWLSEAVHTLLTELLSEIQRAADAKARITQLEGERGTLYGKQEQARANLGALTGSGQEAALRGRMLTQLETSQNRLDEIEQGIAGLQAQVAAAESRVTQILAALG